MEDIIMEASAMQDASQLKTPPCQLPTDKQPPVISKKREKRGDLADIVDVDKKLDLALLPQPLQGLISRVSEAYQVPPEIPLGYSLSILSGALGNSLRISPKEGWEEPPFIWAAILAPTGTGKSPPLKALMEPVYQRESEGELCYLDDFTLESLPEQFKQQPRGLICAIDELRGIFTRLNQYKSGVSDDLEKLNSLWNAGPIKVNRKDPSKNVYSPYDLAPLNWSRYNVAVGLKRERGRTWQGSI